MRIWHIGKVVGAILLAACLALPMVTCTAVPTDDSTRAAAPVPRSEPTANYAVDTPSELPWALAFLWPLGVLAIERYATRGHVRRMTWWLEPVLCVGTLFALQLQVASLLIFGRPAVGYYVAHVAVFFLLVSWAGEGVVEARRRAHAAQQGAAADEPQRVPIDS